MNLNYSKFLFTAFIAVSLSAKAIPTPEAVEPAFDGDDNPTYVIKYGKGDRLKEDGTPLNLIQIECQGKAVDMVSDEELDQCRGDDSLVEMKYGWMDFATYKGWRSYHAECHVCHGPDAMGSTYAPSLMVSLQEGLSYDDFFNVIMNGRGEAEGAQKGNVMPAFGANSNVAPHVEDMYRYVKARAEGKIRRGVRLPKLPKFKEAD
ncbi:MAG: c-type cytochrome [Alphaproteobacteria bacterium]|tara:strand:+ start:516 stop:1130 length:615 start_codon:yes stop_codon:yes gene_type:complete